MDLQATGLEKTLEHSMLSILREAKQEAAAPIVRYGISGFIEMSVKKLMPGFAEIPYPLESIYYEFKTDKDGSLQEVLFHLPVRGDITVFNYMGSMFVRTKGSVEVSPSRRPDRVRLCYKRVGFRDAAALHLNVTEDIDTLRNYLINTTSTQEKYQEELRVQLKKIVSDLEPDLAPTLKIAESLETLSYKRLPGNENVIGNFGKPSKAEGVRKIDFTENH